VQISASLALYSCMLHDSRMVWVKQQCGSAAVPTFAPFGDVRQTAIRCRTTSQKSKDLNAMIVLGALVSMGHGGAVLIHPSGHVRWLS
jgi:hypothetical protein